MNAIDWHTLDQNHTIISLLWQCFEVISDKNFKDNTILAIIENSDLDPKVKNERLKNTLRSCLPHITDAIFCDGVLGILDSMDNEENEVKNEI